MMLVLNNNILHKKCLFNYKNKIKNNKSFIHKYVKIQDKHYNRDNKLQMMLLKNIKKEVI